MKLYNLTYKDDHFVSQLIPNSLPDNFYCYVEIFYDPVKKNINSVKGILAIKEKEDEQEQECVISDLDVKNYIEKLETFCKRTDIDLDKIHLPFVENIENNDDRVLKIFIILLSSYLIYFNFLKFPYQISKNLINNDALKRFTEFSYTNTLEKSFISQVSLFHRYFSEIFNETDTIIEEIIEYKRRLILDLNKKIEALELDKLQSDIKEVKDIKEKLSNLFK